MKHIILCVGFLFGAGLCNGQIFDFEKPYKAPNRFNDCAAIFIDKKMLVDNYSPEGKCKVAENVKGRLTVHSVILSEQGGDPKKQLKFNVAIKNAKTNTIWMYNKEPLSHVFLEDIIHQCDMGDKIFIILEGQKYSLTHNEIEVDWKC